MATDTGPEVVRIGARYKVVSVSENTNSFGLRGMVLVGTDGDAWEVGANYLNARPRGAVVVVPTTLREDLPPYRHWETLGYEISRLLPPAPPAAVKEIWSIPEPEAAAV